MSYAQDDYIRQYIINIAMTCWLNTYVLPKMRTAADARWFLDQFDLGEDLGCMLDFHGEMLVPGDLEECAAK